jgi:Domain of unknown function (DUF1707)
VTAGPGDEMAAAAASRGRLRASHADREHVIDILKAAFVQGRLTKDELDARAGQAFASRTYAELAALTADIPVGLTAAPPPRKPSRARARPPMSKVVAGAALTIPPPALLLAAFLTQDNQLAVAFAMVIPWYFIAWLVAGAQMLDTWHQKRSRGQLPPRPAQRGRALEGEQDGGIGNYLILCEARKDVRTRRVPCHGAIQRIWRSLPVRRDQCRPAGLQVTA